MAYIGNCQFWSVPVGFPGGNWVDGYTNGVQTTFRGGPSDGRVLSIQPDGTEGSRDAGTTGPWETHQDDPALNVWRFTINGVPYAVMYRGA